MKQKKKAFYLGIEAEQQVAQYLHSLSYDIIASRYKTKYGEIDIIAKKNNIIIFVEVKARKDISTIYESITARQKQRIIDSSLIFIQDNPDYSLFDMRFDAIMLTPNNCIDHIENAWGE